MKLLVLLIPLLTTSSIGASELYDKGSVTENGAAGVARDVCATVFVSGLNPLDNLASVSKEVMTPEDRRAITGLHIDHKQKTVSLSVRDEVTRQARLYDDQGCVVLPLGQESVNFTPLRLQSRLPDPATQPWPLGDDGAQAPLPKGGDSALLAEAVEEALEYPPGRIAAFLVVHKGRIVAERYGPGVTPTTPLLSWSMMKSVQATWVGLLENQGELDLFAPVPIQEWQHDGRRAIRLVDLMRMSSGLSCSHPDEHPQDRWREVGYSDYLHSWTGAADHYRFSLHQPLEHPPNTVGRYRDCDPPVIGELIKRTLKRMGEEYLSWPQRAVFDKLGIRTMRVATDAAGNFLTAAYAYASARDWARLGLLYLWDGEFEGERLLSKAFVDYVRTPAPAWEQPVFGANFWLNLAGSWSLPPDAFSMRGGWLQQVYIVPSLDVVVVRLGYDGGDSQVGDVMKHLNPVLAKVVSAIGA